jgi:hypothetical protein
MDNRKVVVPLRVIAARCVSIDEQDGFAEINRIAADVGRMVRRTYGLLWAAVSVALFFTAATMIPGMILAFRGDRIGEITTAIGLIPFAALLGTIAYWRTLQYGGLFPKVPQNAVYANEDDPAVRNLERLFAVLQLETTPRAFYTKRNGERRYIDERYFFNRLRVLYLARDHADRGVLIAPFGPWFSRELFMEADVDALIAETKAKPSRGGAPKTYDYTDAIMSLIEHPAIRAIEDAAKRGTQRRIIDLLEAWYLNKRVSPPSETQLQLYAKSIQETIIKNRAAKS